MIRFIQMILIKGIVAGTLHSKWDECPVGIVSVSGIDRLKVNSSRLFAEKPLQKDSNMRHL